MPEESFSRIELLLIAVAAIAGGLGGAAVAGHYVLRGRRMTAARVAAYFVLGMVFGLLGVIYAASMGLPCPTIAAVVGRGVIAGAIGAGSLAGANLSVSWVLKHLGIEIKVDVKPVGKK